MRPLALLPPPLCRRHRARARCRGRVLRARTIFLWYCSERSTIISESADCCRAVRSAASRKLSFSRRPNPDTVDACKL